MGDFNWGQIIQAILEAMLAVVLPVAVGVLAAWLRARRDEILSHMGEREREMLLQAVDIAVNAAEQSGLAGHIRDVGAEKKKFALDTAEAYLRRWGLEIDLNVLAAMIEAEVGRQFGPGGGSRLLTS